MRPSEEIAHEEGAMVHQSLLRYPTFLGVGFESLVVEGLLLLVAYVLFGIGSQMLIFGLISVVPVHFLLRRYTEKDPDAVRLAWDSLMYERLRPGHGRLYPLTCVVPRPSLPVGR